MEWYFFEQDLLAYKIPFVFVNVDDFLYYDQLVNKKSYATLKINKNCTDKKDEKDEKDEIEKKHNTTTTTSVFLPLVILNNKLVGNSWFDIYGKLFKEA
jgi:hypothetical protein